MCRGKSMEVISKYANLISCKLLTRKIFRFGIRFSDFVQSKEAECSSKILTKFNGKEIT